MTTDEGAPGAGNPRGAGSGHVANGILHQLHDDELLEHQSRIRAVLAAERRRRRKDRR